MALLDSFFNTARIESQRHSLCRELDLPVLVFPRRYYSINCILMLTRTYSVGMFGLSLPPVQLLNKHLKPLVDA